MSNEHAIAQYERETDPPPVKRPWAVMRSYRRYRTGVWTRWRVWGTYSTRDKAVSGALKAQLYGEAKTHVVGPGEARVGPSP